MLRLLVHVAVFVVAGVATAVTLDLDNPNGIATLYVVAGDGLQHGMNYVVCTNGSGYMVENRESGNWQPFVPSPVPLVDVVDWSPWTLYTADGRWFGRSASTDPWEQMGVDMQIPPPPCFVPVASHSDSLGKLKSMFR